MDDLHYVFHASDCMFVVYEMLREFLSPIVIFKFPYVFLKPNSERFPVCPVHFILQSGHFNWYTPLLSYLHWGVSFSMVRCFPIVLLEVNAILMFVSLNNLVINLVLYQCT